MGSSTIQLIFVEEIIVVDMSFYRLGFFSLLFFSNMVGRSPMHHGSQDSTMVSVSVASLNTVLATSMLRGLVN